MLTDFVACMEGLWNQIKTITTVYISNMGKETQLHESKGHKIVNLVDCVMHET